MEQRWHCRYEVNQPARIIANGDPEPQPCLIKNYSMSGLFLETRVPLDRHHFLVIGIPHDGGSTFLRGMVIHNPGGGAGVEIANRFWPRLLGWKEDHTG